MEEKWKSIYNYEGLYEISNIGNIRSCARYISCGRGEKQFRKSKILNPITTPKGYKRITISKDGEKKNFMIHRLVAQAFIPNPDNKPQINHIDGNKQNNNVTNLEWFTNGENQIHAWGTGLNKGSTGMFKGEKHRNAKSVVCKTTGEIFNYIKLASKIYGIDRSDISRCCNGKAKSAGKHPITGEKMVWEWYKGGCNDKMAVINNLKEKIL